MHIFMLSLEIILLIALLIIVRIYFFARKWLHFVDQRIIQEKTYFGPWSEALFKWNAVHWVLHPHYYNIWTVRQFEPRFRKEFNIPVG